MRTHAIELLAFCNILEILLLRRILFFPPLQNQLCVRAEDQPPIHLPSSWRQRNQAAAAAETASPTAQFHLYCQLSAQNLSCLSGHSFLISLRVSMHLAALLLGFKMELK